MASIDLPHVNSFVDRYGKVRHYFRRRGHKAIPLPGLPGSKAYMAAYSLALGVVPDKVSEIGASRTLPGTINALVVSYYESEGWQAGSLKRARPATASSSASGCGMVTSESRCYAASTRTCSPRSRAVGEAALAEGYPRAVAVRGPEHAQGRSSRRHRRHQAAQEQRASHLDR